MKYILTLLCLSSIMQTCNIKQEYTGHYHLNIISPLYSEISGNEANVVIDKCKDITGRWRLVLDGMEVINQESMKTEWPFTYKWDLKYSGEHLMSVHLLDANGKTQSQHIRIFN